MRSDFIILFMSYFFFFLFIFFIIILFFIPLTCIRYVYKNTSYSKFGNTRANVSVKRNICDVKICD